MRVALVGCGSIGRVHSDVIGSLSGLSIAAVVDPEHGAADSMADRIEMEGAPRPLEFSSLEDALSSTDVDLVVLATPSGGHADDAILALGLHKHVIVEKPIDASVSRAIQVVYAAAEARRHGVVCSVMSQHRFDPGTRFVSEMISAGRLGRVTSASASVAWWRGQAYYDSAPWRGTWEFDGGGALLNQGIHTVDLLAWLLGTPLEVTAAWGRLSHADIEVEDTIATTIKFESGAIASLHATTGAFPGVTTRLQLHGDEGSATIEEDRLTYFHVSGEAEQPVGPYGVQHGEQNRADSVNDMLGVHEAEEGLVPGHRRQYLDILDAIETGREPGVTASDALLALAVVRSAYLAAQWGTPVDVSEVMAGRLDEPLALEPATHE